MKLFHKSKPGKNPAPTKPLLSKSIVLKNGELVMSNEPVQGLKTALDRIVQITPVYLEKGHYILGLSEHGNCYAFDPVTVAWQPQTPSPLFGEYFGNSILL